MKFTKKILSVVLLLSMIVSGNIVANASEKGEKYNVDEIYPVTIESKDWFEYSVQEKCEMLKIEDEKLDKMTDEQLVRSIADYPYLVDIYLYDTMEQGLKSFAKTCDAYGELMARVNGKESMEKYGRMLIAEMKETSREDGRTEFVTAALEDMIVQLEENSELSAKSYVEQTSGPKTPKNSAVAYRVNSEAHTAAQHADADQEIVKTYGVTLVRNGSCKYNCHSYAWYSTSSANPYWIDDPTIYTTDGSYSKVYKGGVSNSIVSYGVKSNDKVFYAEATHSAIFIDNPANGAPLATLKVRSKWGKLGVFQHTVTNVPEGYKYSTISIWHR